jgi:hypothetical protein
MKQIISTIFYLLIGSIFTFGSTVGIATGNKTVDGRPLLFKNKDQTDDYPSDVNYYDGGIENYSYVYQQNNGQDHTRTRMGINSVGFGIVYSDSENLDGADTGPSGSQLTAIALKTCATINEFRNLLNATNGARTAHNHFAVIDSTGQGSMFEVDGYTYVEIPINDSIGAMANTAKFHPNRGAPASGSTSPEREARAIYLLSNGSSEGLDYKYFVNEIIKDYCKTQEDEDKMPVGQYLTNPVLSRYKTAAGCVIRGMISGDNPRYSNLMWIALSEPSLTIALPLFGNVNQVPNFIRSNSAGDGMAGSSDRVRKLIYDYSDGRYSDRYADTYKLVSIKEKNNEIQDSVFNSLDKHLNNWKLQNINEVDENIKTWINETHYWAKSKYDSINYLLGINDLNEEEIYSTLSLQNFPNPFNSSTIISYSVPPKALSKRSFVKLNICDVLGKKIIELVNGYQNHGAHEIEFEASSLASGNYYCTLEVEQSIVTTKMVYLK